MCCFNQSALTTSDWRGEAKRTLVAIRREQTNVTRMSVRNCMDVSFEEQHRSHRTERHPLCSELDRGVGEAAVLSWRTGHHKGTKVTKSGCLFFGDDTN